MGFFGAAQLARARFYDDLATTLDAGLGALEALRTIGSGADGLGPAAMALETRLHGGRSFADAMAEEPRTWSLFERRIVEAGDRGGRLPQTLRRLGQHFQQRGNMRDQIGYGLMYPVAVIHVAFLLPDLKLLILDGDTVAYAKAALLPIGILWAAVLLGILLVRCLRATQATRRRIDAVAFGFPWVSKTARLIAMHEYVSTLGALFASGIPATEAMRSAADATGNSVMAEAGMRAAERVRGGDRMHEALASESAAFPRLLIEAVKLGETSGKMDETLDRVERSTREDVDRRIRIMAAVIPKVIYFGVLLVVAYKIVTFYTGYYRQLGDILK